MAIQDLIQQHLTPEMIDQISGQIGADPATTRQAVNAAVPMLMGGVAAHASTPQGAQALESATTTADQGGGILGGLGGMLGGSGSSGGLADVIGGLGGMMSGGGLGGILGNMLGGHEASVQDGVSKASGLDPKKAQRLLMILGPIVLAAIAHHKSKTGASASQVSNELQREAQTHAASNPHVGGLLGDMLTKAGVFRNP